MDQCKQLKLVLCAALALLAAACSPGRHAPDMTPERPAPSNVAEALGSLPSIAELDSLPGLFDGKGASLVSYTTMLAEPLTKSPGAVMSASGEQCTLNSSAGGIEWIIHRVDTANIEGIEVLGYEVYAQNSQGQAWVGIADFAAGRWDFDQIPGQDLEGLPIDLDNQDYRSAADLVYFATISFGGDKITANGMRASVDRGSTEVTEVLAPTGASETAIVELHGRPGIVYQDAASGILQFAWAASAAPTGPLDWTVSTLSNLNNAGEYLDAAVVGDALYVAYVTGGDELRLATFPDAPDMNSSSATDELVFTAETLHWVNYVTLRASGERLHLCWTDQDFLDIEADNIKLEVMYAERLLSGWSWESKTLTTDYNNNFSRPDMELIEGLPGVACRDTQNGLTYWAAQRDGAGELFWSWSAPDYQCKDNDIAVHEIDGRPMLEFRDGVNDVPRFIHSEVPRPFTKAHWGVDVGGTLTLSGQNASRMVDGLPMAARISSYQNYKTLHLFRGISTQANQGQPYMLQYYTWEMFGGTPVSGISVGQLQGEISAAWIQEDTDAGTFSMHFARIKHDL